MLNLFGAINMSTIIGDSPVSVIVLPPHVDCRYAVLPRCSSLVRAGCLRRPAAEVAAGTRQRMGPPQRGCAGRWSASCPPCVSGGGEGGARRALSLNARARKTAGLRHRPAGCRLAPPRNLSRALFPLAATARCRPFRGGWVGGVGCIPRCWPPSCFLVRRGWTFGLGPHFCPPPSPPLLGPCLRRRFLQAGRLHRRLR